LKITEIHGDFGDLEPRLYKKNDFMAGVKKDLEDEGLKGTELQIALTVFEMLYFSDQKGTDKIDGKTLTVTFDSGNSLFKDEMTVTKP
jgi:hypothetical protein